MRVGAHDDRHTAARSVLRFILVAVIALFAALNTVTDITLLWHPFADLGLTIDASHVIVGVDPHRAADRAGIRVGDRIDDAETPMSSRRHLHTGVTTVPAGVPVPLAIQTSAGVRRVVLVGEPHPRSLADNVTNTVLVLAVAAAIIIGAWLVLLRPSRMTWAFFLYCGFSTVGAVTTAAVLPPSASMVNAVCYGAVSFSSVVAFVIFALRFPDDRVDGWRRPAERIALAALAVTAPLGAYVRLGPALGAPIGLAAQVASCVDIAGVVFGALVFGLSYAHARAGDRAKIRWVALGLTVGYAGPLAFSIGTALPGFAFEWPIPVINLVQALEIAVPLSVAYVIVRHRVFDVRFVLGRAAVYGVVTTIAVVGVTLLEYTVGKLVAETRLAVIGDAAVALAVGLSLNGVHKRVDATIERLFFRQRRRAEEHLRRVGDGLTDAASADGIAHALVDETTSSLHLTSCAVFTRDARFFVRRAATGWSGVPDTPLDADLGAILALAARRDPLAVGDGHWPQGALPGGLCAPLWAFPILVRKRLEAIVFVGPHTGGERIDPEEVALICELCDDAAAAYEHLDASVAIARNTSLEAEIAILRTLVSPTEQRLMEPGAPSY